MNWEENKKLFRQMWYILIFFLILQIIIAPWIENHGGREFIKKYGGGYVTGNDTPYP